MSIFKLAETVQMSIDVPDAEKKVAANTVFYLEKIVKRLDTFNKHLNIIYDPFKEFDQVSKESILENRDALWNYRQQITKNFIEIRKLCLEVVKGLNVFNSDTHILELVGAFTDDVEDVDKQVDSLSKVLSNWNNANYKANVISAIELLKKEIAELRKMVDDRIIDHINSNILAKNWVSNISEELNVSIQKEEPLISKLHKERQDALNQVI